MYHVPADAILNVATERPDLCGPAFFGRFRNMLDRGADKRVPFGWNISRPRQMIPPQQHYPRKPPQLSGGFGDGPMAVIDQNRAGAAESLFHDLRVSRRVVINF